MSNLEKVMKDFQNIGEEKQADIILDFSEAFKNKNNCKSGEFFTEFGKRYKSLKWSEFVNNHNFMVSNGADESALDNLFKRFPKNTNIDEVYIKVLAINSLYHTYLCNSENGKNLSMKEMARHIFKNACDIDDTSKVSPIKIVDRLGNKDNLNGDVNNAYSFASKYLSFTYRNKPNGKDLVPITDTNAREVLKFMNLSKVHNLENYSNYYAAITELKNKYSQINKSIGYKEIDAFLWIMGKAFR